ncbi:F22F7.17 PROTEIN [Salix purpurea]|uniref:F22F7.17 PROTEIN n=1 Tax=Salix purpurea TaxID=77065 RepID=A0A9Q0WBR9_SALPP|nr:F22F7.17 PROTEIN [Salix purpurea]
MGRLCSPKCRLGRVMGWLQILLGGLVIAVSIASLFKFYSAGFFLHHEDICQHFYHVSDAHDGFDLRALSDRVGEVLDRMDKLQEKLEKTVQEMEKNKVDLGKTTMTRLEHKKIRLPQADGIRNSTMKEVPLINTFIVEEIRKYITPKENRVGNMNIYGTERIYNTIGHACVLMKKELEEYMDYDIGSYCKDDWSLSQKLMVNGCDPLPRRRCLTRASKVYQKPYPINESSVETAR